MMYNQGTYKVYPMYRKCHQVLFSITKVEELTGRKGLIPQFVLASAMHQGPGSIVLKYFLSPLGSHQPKER